MKFLLLLGLVVLPGFTCTKIIPGNTQIKTVKEVGVCDQSGYCAVTFSDNSYGTVQYPSQGKKFCMEKRGLEWVTAYDVEMCKNQFELR